MNPEIRFDCKTPILFTKVARFRPWIDKELNREPPIYTNIGPFTFSTSTPTPVQKPETKPTRTTSPTTTRRSVETYYTTRSSQPKEREPLTPEPFLIPHYSTYKPPEVETYPKRPTTTTDQPLSVSIFSVPTYDTDAELVSMSSKATQVQSSNGVRVTKYPTPIYPIIPTRFPISTERTQFTQRQRETSTSTDSSIYIPRTSEKTFPKPVVGQSSGNYYCPPLPPIQVGKF